MKTVTIYTDGACSGNPGPGGWGAILMYGAHKRELSGGEADTTNNRMELTAVIQALSLLKEPCIVDLWSDSKYVIDGLEKGWARGWQRRGWVKSDKKPALNPDLWGRLLELEEIAAEEIQANGYHYAVTVELEDTMFPTREYEGFTLPAGKYLALRAVIGGGAGRNWWCVVFPPLCAAASAEVPETALAAGLSPSQVGLITEEDQGYVLKSKLVEFWRTLEGKLEGS